MNKKILRKLTLSAVTLGVAALSVTTSTFAWFTTNSTASASGISAETTAKTADLYLNTKSAVGSSTWAGWKIDATLNAETDMTSLVPVAFKNQSTDSSKEEYNAPTGTVANDFVKAGASAGTFTKAASVTDVMHYQVKFSLSSLPSQGGYVEMNISDLVGSEGTQYLLVDAGTGAKAGQYIKVDIRDVLSMGIHTLIYQEDTSVAVGEYVKDSSNADDKADGYYRYIAESDKVLTASVSKGSVGEYTEAEGDAHTCYNNTYGLSGDNAISQSTTYNSFYKTTAITTKETKDSTTTYTPNTIKLFNVKPASGQNRVYVLVDFYFFIDGFDKQCFNAASGLTFNSGKMNFELKLNSADSSSSKTVTTD